MPIPAEWTGELVGQMHNTRVTLEDLAKELGVTKGYISMILNGSRAPDGAEDKLNAAFDRILAERGQSGPTA